MHSKHNIKFFTGRSSRYLSERIADSFGIPLGKSNVTVFSDGEFQPSFDESVRGCTVFIIQSTFPPVDNLFELLLMVDAAHRASAYKVVAVMSYFGWVRQDRKDKPRVAIGAKMVANMLRAAGVDRIMTMDLHADQIQGFFDVPVDHLYASSVFVPYLKSLQIDNIAIASPDMGGAKRANAYARFMNASLVLCYKNREKANQVDEMTIIGDVRGKNVVILDDMVDTAGTLAKASGLMKDQGALSVRAFATHPVMSGKSYELIRDSQIDQLVVTDTIPLRSDRDTSKIKVLSVAELFADVIEKVYNYKSISEKFII